MQTFQSFISCVACVRGAEHMSLLQIVGFFSHAIFLWRFTVTEIDRCGRRNNGTVYLGGPALVKAATGEDADEQQLGGGDMHTSKSGVLDHLAENEQDGCLKVRSCRLSQRIWPSSACSCIEG